MSKKVNIKLIDWDSECADGCCYDYGVKVFVDGVEVANTDGDREVILIAVLKHLGYEVECYIGM